MALDLKKLLPSNMRNNRWGEFIEVLQNILIDDVKVNKVDIIKTQYQIEQATTAELKRLASMFGNNVQTLTGYTLSDRYIQRSLLTLIPRILYKNTRRGYKNIHYIYNLIGDIFPLYEDNDSGSLKVLENWWTSSEYEEIINILDSGDDNLLYKLPIKLDTGLTTLDQGDELDTYYNVYSSSVSSNLPDGYLDSGDITTLDEVAVLDNLTRHLIFTYKHIFVEDSSDFLSFNTHLTLRDNLKNMKKATEIIYIEPKLEINTNSNGTATTRITTWTER